MIMNYYLSLERRYLLKVYLPIIRIINYLGILTGEIVMSLFPIFKKNNNKVLFRVFILFQAFPKINHNRLIVNKELSFHKCAP